MRPFLKNNAVFYKTMSKLVPSATPKTIGNLKNLIFTTVENYVYFCYCFLHEIVGKWPLFLEVDPLTFGVILQPFFSLWLPRPHLCKKAWFLIKNYAKVTLKVDPKIAKMVSWRLCICIFIGRFGRTRNAKFTGCGDGPPQASSIYIYIYLYIYICVCVLIFMYTYLHKYAQLLQEERLTKQLFQIV